MNPESLPLNKIKIESEYPLACQKMCTKIIEFDFNTTFATRYKLFSKIKRMHSLMLTMLFVASSLLDLQSAEDRIPDYFIEESTWEATDIVLLTEGSKINGLVNVVETWRGQLEVGEKLQIPDFEKISSEEFREIYGGFAVSDKSKAYPLTASGMHMILFLKDLPPSELNYIESDEGFSNNNFTPTPLLKLDSSKGTLTPALPYGIDHNIVWIEKDSAFCVGVIRIQWKSRIQPSSLETEAGVKSYVQKLNNYKDLLASAKNEPIPSKRLSKLIPLVRSDSRHLNEMARDLLATCGPEAITVLHELFKSETGQGAYQAVQVLLKIKEARPGKIYLNWLKDELEYWAKEESHLEVGWWDNYTLESEKRSILKQRYDRMQALLQANKTYHRSQRKSPAQLIISFSKYWDSLPTNQDVTQFERISHACNVILNSLPHQK